MAPENNDYIRSTWSLRYGSQCPSCGVYTKSAYKHLPWTDTGYKVIYMRCPACGENFKDVIVDTASMGISPTQDQLRYLRLY